MRDSFYLTCEYEPTATVASHRRLRRQAALGILSLLLASVAYLGFIRQSSDSDNSAPAVSGRVMVQKAKPPVAMAQRPAAVAPPAPRHVATAVATAAAAAAAVAAPVATAAAAPPDVKRAVSKPDKPRVDVSKHLRAARADLQKSNLAATKARLSAAIAAQPGNPHALRMRSTLSEREQQRDSLLSVARGCEYIEQWSCVSHNAGNALLVDSSSAEAKRLVERAMRESEVASVVTAEPAPAPSHEENNPATHH
ncbi:hypothetical protein [Paraburkholderia lacunae]|uniref:hypothetical protein n=1 Tax=Paraburkholderia lacunae TaxID=2211104 RepID=UPI001FCC52E9|nr:hypothetical protein [Paraburkholderia lacunae]